MDILVFSSAPTYPLTAGNSVRVFSIGDRLKRRGHGVHFVYFDHQARMSLEQAHAMHEQWDSFHYIPFQGQRRHPQNEPWDVDDWFQSDIGIHLPLITAMLKPDAVICNYAFHSKVFEFVNPEAVRIIDTHDAFTDRHLMLDAAGLPRRFYYTTRDREAAQLRRADIVLAIQKPEAELFTSMVGKPVYILGHLVDRVELPRADAPVLRVGYIGSGNHLNQLAMRKFLEAARADLSRGAYEFVVAGGVCDAIEAHQPVTRLGMIDLLADFYSRIDVAINPMAYGTGLKIKTIEALQHGVPIVSTVCGFEGLSSPAREHALDQPSDVAEAVLRLAEDRSGLAKLADVSHSVFEAYSAEHGAVFDQVFGSRETLQQAAGGGDVLLMHARNAASQTVVIATHARFWLDGLGSHVRIRQLVEELCLRYRVVVFITWKLTQADQDAIAEMKLPVEIVGLSEDSSLFDAALTEDILLGRIADAEILRAFRALVRRIPASVCIIEYLTLSFLLKALPTDTLRIIDTHDLISRRAESQAAMRQALMIGRSAEMTALADYDFMLMIQRTELAVADTWGFGGRALYVPIHFTPVSRPTSGHDRRRVGFIGAASDANHDGLTWFLRHVWPFFLRRRVELHVAGSIGRRLVAPPANVRVLGHVDIDEFYSTLDIAINPVQWGSGLKIKTVEALSRGIPVIATSEGAVGVEEAEGHGLIIADRPIAYAHALSTWLRNDEERQIQGESARDFVTAEFNRAAVFRDLHTVIQSASPARILRGHRLKRGQHA